MKTLSQVLIDANSYLDLEAAEPTGTDLAVRINYAQQAINEWGAAYNWRQLNEHKEITPSMASISLPSNFRNFIGAPRFLNGSGVWLEYPQILIEEKYSKDSSDKYCYTLGNPSSGYTLVLNGMASYISFSYDYQRYPSNVATLTDVVEVDDGEYIKTKVISYVLQSRSDDRFPLVEADANRMLSNMIGREMNRTPGGSGSAPKRGVAAYAIGRGR